MPNINTKDSASATQDTPADCLKFIMESLDSEMGLSRDEIEGLLVSALPAITELAATRNKEGQ